MTDSRSYPDNTALRQVLEQARDFIDPDRDPPRINNRKLVMKINAVLSRVDAQGSGDCGAEAQFLLDRLDEFDPGEEDAERDFHGHVAPAIARLRSALSSTNGDTP